MVRLPPGIALFARLLKETFNHWLDDNATRLAAAVAYYTLFSLAPLLVLVIAFAGLLFGEEAARGEIVGQFRDLVGATGAEVIESTIRNARRPGGTGILATFLGILVLLFGASNAFAQMQEALNLIWKVQPRPGSGVRNFLRKRLLTFSMIVAIGFLLLVSLLLSAALAAAGSFLFGHFTSALLLWRGLNFFFSLIVITLLFAMILKILPDARIAWQDVWSGAAITALLFSFGKFLLGFYLGSGTFSSAYGAAGSLVIFLAWVYYSAQILFFGAEFTAARARHRQGTIDPEPHAIRTDGVSSRKQKRRKWRQKRGR